MAINSKGLGNKTMDFYRAKEKDSKYIKFEKSFIHTTALIASEDHKTIGVLEYDIKNIEEAEIINLNIFESCEENIVLKGFIDEIIYWNPYLKRILYNEVNDLASNDALLYCGFKNNGIWSLLINNNIEAFKINLNEIIPEQLTIDKVKLDRVSSWIDKPEDVVASCVKIGEKIVSIDGHSRLVSAFNKGFEYVYAYFEPDNGNIEFYKTCLQWCQEENIFTIKDLAGRVVTPEEHERLWGNKCQAYLKEHEENNNGI